MRWLDGITDSIGTNLSKLRVIAKDRGAWGSAIHGVAKSQTRLSDFTFTFHFPALEKEMAKHPSILAWEILWTVEPGRLVHGVVKSWTRPSEFTFTFHFPALEKEMATHSSILTWRIPGMGEPVELPSMGSHRVGHN